MYRPVVEDIHQHGVSRLKTPHEYWCQRQSESCKRNAHEISAGEEVGVPCPQHSHLAVINKHIKMIKHMGSFQHNITL